MEYSFYRLKPFPLFWTRYKDVLVSMMTNVLRKIQLHFNIDELREVDDDTIDDDVSRCMCTGVDGVGVCVCVNTPSPCLCWFQNETEWQSFLRQCLEFVGKVAELFPHEAFHLIVSRKYTTMSSPSDDFHFFGFFGSPDFLVFGLVGLQAKCIMFCCLYSLCSCLAFPPL